MSDHHAHPELGGTRALAAAIALNTGITAAEAAVGALVGSLALLADALHNLSDVTSLVFTWVAARLARRDPTSTRTFGFLRAEPLVAFVNGLLLLPLAAGMVWVGLHRLVAGGSPPGPTVMVVGAVALVANVASALVLAPHARDDLGTRSALLHLVADAASSGAVIVGGALVWAGIPGVDPILSVGIGLLVLRSAFKVLAEAAHLLVDGAPRGTSAEKVATCLRTVAGVSSIHHVHVWSISSRLHAVSAHVVVPDGPLSGAQTLMRRLEAQLRDSLGILHSTLQLETAPCEEASVLADPRLRLRRMGGES